MILKIAEFTRDREVIQNKLNSLPKPKSVTAHRDDAQRGFDNHVRSRLRVREFDRVAIEDPRYGGSGVCAMLRLSMYGTRYAAQNFEK